MTCRCRSTMYVFCALACLIGSGYCQASQNAMGICTGLYNLSMYDTDNILSAKQYFQQVQNILKDSTLSQYSDLQNTEKSLGGSFSDLGDAIGLSDSAKTDSSVFQSQMHDFLSSSFESSGQKTYFEEHRSTINQGILGVMNTCINQYFKSIQTGLGVEVTPGYSDFSVLLIGKSSDDPPPNLKITGMTPDSVHCTRNGNSVPLNQDLGATTVLLECKKDETAEVPNLRFTTNVGPSGVISLPAKGTIIPHPAPPPAPPEPIRAVWKAALPVVGNAIGGHCTCVSVSYSSKQATLSNKCGDQVQAIAVERTNWYRGLSPYPLKDSPIAPLTFFPTMPLITHPEANEKYASVSIPSGREATFDLSDGTGGAILFTACPTQSLPALFSEGGGFYLLPAVSAAMACYVEHGTGGNATPSPIVCDAAAGSTAGNGCTCNLPAMGGVPAKSYSGKATHLNCQDGSAYKPCDL